MSYECGAMKDTATSRDPACHNPVKKEGQRCWKHPGQPHWTDVPADERDGVFATNQHFLDLSPDQLEEIEQLSGVYVPAAYDLPASDQLARFASNLDAVRSALRHETSAPVKDLVRTFADSERHSRRAASQSDPEAALREVAGEVVAALVALDEVVLAERRPLRRSAEARALDVAMHVLWRDDGWPFLPRGVRPSEENEGEEIAAEVDGYVKIEGKLGDWITSVSLGSGDVPVFFRHSHVRLARMVGWESLRRFDAAFAS